MAALFIVGEAFTVVALFAVGEAFAVGEKEVGEALAVGDNEVDEVGDNDPVEEVGDFFVE